MSYEYHDIKEEYDSRFSKWLGLILAALVLIPVMLFIISR